MPAFGQVDSDEKWQIVIEVEGELDRQHTINFDKAIKDAVTKAQAGGTPAKITVNKKVPKASGSGESPGGR
jgi:homoserine kinase